MTIERQTNILEYCDDNKIILNLEFVKKFGIEPSLFLSGLYFWIKNNQDQCHFYDERFWMCSSINSFTKLFSFLSHAKIRRILNFCLKNDYILKGNFNKHKFDHTIWYALSDASLEILENYQNVIN